MSTQINAPTSRATSSDEIDVAQAELAEASQHALANIAHQHEHALQTLLDEHHVGTTDQTADPTPGHA